MDSREALIHAINDFEGAVILVAHDRHIVETCADRLLLVADQTIKTFDGDLDDYAQFVLSQRRKQQTGGTREQPPIPRQPSRPAKQLSKQLADLDTRMQKIQEKLTVLDKVLADHTIYREEPLKAADFAKLRTKLANDLARDEELWLNLQEEIANA
jgi:ATP-binding cassette subfamily F protein 3